MHRRDRGHAMTKGSRTEVDYRIVVVLAAAFVVAFGLAVWLWLAGRPPGEGSAEAGFARDMMIHHAQAVEMAEVVQNKTQNEQIRVLASDIALTQQAQIGQMQGWLAVWDLSATGTKKPMAWMGQPMEGRMPGMATPEDIDRLKKASPNEADEMFLKLMIPHHRAAIPMAEAILKRTDRPEVRQLAEAIVASQRAEAQAMQQMLKSMDAPPVKGDPKMKMNMG
jgi:uncharacterized protein (DUF305 family)